MNRASCVVAVVVAGFVGHAHADQCPPVKRTVFDPPGKRHSLPQLAHDGKVYSLVGYDGPPLEMHLSVWDGTSKPKFGKIGSGGLAATATDGKNIGVVFVATAPAAGQQPPPPAPTPTPAPAGKPPTPPVQKTPTPPPTVPPSERYQTYFTVVSQFGKVVVPRVALGDQAARHGAPGVAVAWNPQAKEWGVVWMEAVKLQFARVDEKGKVIGTRELSPSGQVNPHGRLLWNGTTYAYVMPSRYGLSLLEFDDKQLKETPIGVASALEPVVAFSNGTYGIAFRTERELAFVRVKNGKELGRSVLASVPGPSYGGRRTNNPSSPSAPPTQPAPPAPRLGSISLASDGNGWAIIWSISKGPGFDDRLMFSRLDEKGALLTGAARRLDDEDKHQGYASIAGSGCGLAATYIIGDPNGDVRIGFTRLP